MKTTHSLKVTAAIVSLILTIHSSLPATVFDFSQEKTIPPSGWKCDPIELWSMQKNGDGTNAWHLAFPGLIESAGASATTQIENISDRDFKISADFSIIPGKMGTAFWGIGFLAQNPLFTGKKGIGGASFYLVDLGFVQGKKDVLVRIVKFNRESRPTILVSQPLSGIVFNEGQKYRIEIRANYTSSDITLTAFVTDPAYPSATSKEYTVTDSEVLRGDYFGFRCFPVKTQDFQVDVYQFKVESVNAASQ